MELNFYSAPSELAALFNWAYLVLNTVAFMFVSPRRMKKSISAANLSMAFSAFLVGQIATALLCLFTFIRVGVSAFTEDFSSKQRIAFCTLFCLVQVALFTVLWSSSKDLLPLTIGLFTSVMFFYANNLWLRVGLVVSSIAWAFNGALIGNWHLVIGQAPGALLSLVMAFKILRARRSAT